MKKVCSICVSAVMALTLCACGDTLNRGFDVVSGGIDHFRNRVTSGIKVVEETGEKVEETVNGYFSETEEESGEKANETVDEIVNSTENENIPQSDEESDENKSKEDDGLQEPDTVNNMDSYVAAYSQTLEKNYEKYPVYEDENYEYPFEDYLVYDIDKDGIPELIMRFGHKGTYENEYEDDYIGAIFTMRDNSIYLLEEDINLSNFSFYTDPGENGILMYYAGVNHVELERMYISGDEVKFETIHEEKLDKDRGDLNYRKNAEVTDPDEFVNGAIGLSFYLKSNTLAVRKYDEILEHIEGKRVKNSKAGFPNDDESFYTDILMQDKKIIVVPSDTYMKDAGTINIRDMYNDNVLYEYTNGKLNLKEIKYVDLNEDNLYEAVLYLAGKDEEKKGDYLCRVILSQQDNNIYAYTKFYPTEADITKSGNFVFAGPYGTYSKRVIFDKKEVQSYTVPVY